MIKALNGGTDTRLGDWLANAMPTCFGASAGSSNLAGRSNAAVAALFQKDFEKKGDKSEAQVLATALAFYVTNATPDQTPLGERCGFTVSGDGVGTVSVRPGVGLSSEPSRGRGDADT